MLGLKILMESREKLRTKRIVTGVGFKTNETNTRRNVIIMVKLVASATVLWNSQLLVKLLAQ